MSDSHHYLIAGATGLVGRAAMEHFARHGHRVTALSRRLPPETYGATHICLDLDDAAACDEVVGGLRDVTHVVFCALYERDSLMAGWREDEQIQKNGRLLANLLEPLSRRSSLRHVVLLQGPKAYGMHVRQIPVGAREDQDELRDVPNFYWVQEDYLRAKQASHGWAWTIFRPAMVVGEAVKGAMNIVAAIGVYGAILRKQGEPLHYPGTAGLVVGEATDTRLMARAFEWAGTAPAAQNQIFNITNGEFFTLRHQWKNIADCLGMEAGEHRPLVLAEAMSVRAPEWDLIRQRYDLSSPSMPSFVAQSFEFADFNLGHSTEDRRVVSAMSTVKIRQAGFHESMYTADMFRYWFDRYQRARLLPRP